MGYAKGYVGGQVPKQDAKSLWRDAMFPCVRNNT